MNQIEKILAQFAEQYKNDGSLPLNPDDFKKDLTGKYFALNINERKDKDGK